jgi:hypothetical protein
MYGYIYKSYLWLLASFVKYGNSYCQYSAKPCLFHEISEFYLLYIVIKVGDKNWLY